MAILSRIFQICKADIHGVMDQIEDPGLLLKQYLREMEESLEEKAVRLASIGQAFSGMNADILRRETEIEKLGSDADLALQRGRDDIARMLIRKRRSMEAVCGRLKNRVRSLALEREDLLETLERQRLRYDELKARAAVFRTHSGSGAMASANEPPESGGGFPTALEEEVELELLQRKESLQQEGAP